MATNSNPQPDVSPSAPNVPPPAQGHFGPVPPGYPPQGFAPPGTMPPGYPVAFAPPSGYAHPHPSYAHLGYPVQGYPMQAPAQHSGFVPSPVAQSLPAQEQVAAVAILQEERAETEVAPSAEESRNQIENEGGIYHPPALTHIEPAKPKNAFAMAWAKVGGGGLTLSLAIHAGLIILAGSIYLVVKQQQKQVDFLPGGGTQQGQQASADMKHQVKNKKRSTISKSVPMKKVVSTSTTATMTLPEAPPDLLDVPDVSSMMGGSMGGGGFGSGGSGGGFGSGVGMGAASNFVSLPPSMRSRCSPTERLEKLRQSGGSPECEVAVTKSLAWLKTKQNPDGSWGKTNKAAMTGLTLLCYLGRCETPDSPFYGENVMNGILYLVELGKKNKWGLLAEDAKKHSSSYEHGIATYALGEMYTLARLGSRSLPGMKEAFEKGVELILDNQLEDGGWGYGEGGDYCYRRTGRGDLSVTGWQYQALKAAKNTSLKIKNLHKGIDHAVDYLLASQTKDGGFGNTNRDAGYNQWNLSGCGLLGLQTLGKTAKKSVTDKGIKFLTDFVTAEPLDWNKNCNLYAWYYMTQTMFQAGGDSWKMYNQQLLPQILENQGPDGVWKTERPNSPIAASSTAGADREIYRQVLCTLQLEVYYRYLKVADREEGSFFDN